MDSKVSSGNPNKSAICCKSDTVHSLRSLEFITSITLDWRKCKTKLSSISQLLCYFHATQMPTQSHLYLLMLPLWHMFCIWPYVQLGLWFFPLCFFFLSCPAVNSEYKVAQLTLVAVYICSLKANWICSRFGYVLLIFEILSDSGSDQLQWKWCCIKLASSPYISRCMKSARVAIIDAISINLFVDPKD